MQGIDPLQLAIKISPPKIALIYRSSNKAFIHEIPLKLTQLEALTTEELLEAIYSKHPGYLEKVDPNQLLNLLDMLKDEISGDHRDDPSEHNARLDSYENEFYGDQGEIDFEALDHDMEFNSDEDEVF
jgi:hypothetical protein